MSGPRLDFMVRTRKENERRIEQYKRSYCIAVYRGIRDKAFTTYELAMALDVSFGTVQRWSRIGKVECEGV